MLTLFGGRISRSHLICATKPGKSRTPSGALPSSRCVKVGVNSLERSDSVVSGAPEKKLLIVAARLSGVSAKVARLDVGGRLDMVVMRMLNDEIIGGEYG